MLGKNKKPSPLVLIEISKNYKSIFNLKKCCGLDVIVESLKIKQETVQCHRCQLFGHAQKNCRDDFKCMKCSENHSTHLCEKPRTTPAKCANCGGEHTAKYLLCKLNPNNPNNSNKNENIESNTTQKVPQNKSNSNDIPSSNKEQQQTNIKPTYAKILSGSNNNNQNKTNTNDLPTLLGQIFMDFSLMNPTNQQKIDLFEKIDKIIKLFNGKNN